VDLPLGIDYAQGEQHRGRWVWKKLSELNPS
jgi:hypothetical protein